MRFQTVRRIGELRSLHRLGVAGGGAVHVGMKPKTTRCGVLAFQLTWESFELRPKGETLWLKAKKN